MPRLPRDRTALLAPLFPRRRVAALTAAVTALAMLAGTAETQNAVANGDTRTLSLIHEHTKESATITFKRDGRYDRAALDQLNWLLRDWREKEATKMDPRLFDVVWEAQRALGSTQPLRIICGYRSPKTNGALRRRSSGVAEHSQHMLGKAMDFFMTDASIDDLRAAGIRLQRGGVGWYPRSGSPFVHLDVGSVRAWPRMTRDQLARIFPDGKTVHLPADGRPMARYEEARAELLARGVTVGGQTSVAGMDPVEDGPGIKGFFAGLFGGKSDAASGAPTDAAAKPAPKAVAVASADPEAGAPQALAYAGPEAARRDTPSARALLTAETGTTTGPATGPVEASRRAPLPPRRPAEFAAANAALAAALPPARPVQVAAIGDAGLAGLAATSVQQAASIERAPAQLVPAEADPRTQMRALFQGVAQGGSEPARRDAPVRIAAIQARTDTAPEGLFTAVAFEDPESRPSRFSARSPGDDLTAARFTGSATAGGALAP